jgi:large subunit ribosomal protein L9
MEVILLKDQDNLGEKHEIVTVKPGYGRNFLIPQGIAIAANEGNRAKLDELKAKEAAELAARKAEFEAIRDRLKGQVLKIGAKAGTSGKIFGSVTTIQIVAALKEQFDLEVIRKKVILPEEDVKELGTYTLGLDLHPEVDIQLDFEVMAE